MMNYMNIKIIPLNIVKRTFNGKIYLNLFKIRINKDINVVNGQFCMIDL